MEGIKIDSPFLDAQAQALTQEWPPACFFLGRVAARSAGWTEVITATRSGRRQCHFDAIPRGDESALSTELATMLEDPQGDGW